MTVEILPNWHPVFVHFTVGVLFLSVGLYSAGAILRKEGLRGQLLIAARLNLWIGTLITIGTVLAGFYAFNTVPHRFEAQHLAMLDHRKWALGTASLFVFLSLWSFVAALRGKDQPGGWAHALFLVLLLLAGCGLAATGYKGGELVFRHGLGVMPQPMPQEESHHGQEGHGNHHH